MNLPGAELPASFDLPASPTRAKWSKYNNFALLATFAVGVLVYFNALGNVPLFNPDEALYAEPAREMLESGDYLTTHLNYIVRYTKPPLVIWAQALCFSLFGVSELAARAFGAACGVLLVVATQAFVTRYAGLRAGLIASFALLTAPLYFATSRECITDIPLSLFLAGALMSFYCAFHERQSKFFALAGYCLIAFAVMTKGPVSIVLPVAILGTFYLTTGHLKAAWQKFFPIVGALIVAVIALPWFVLEIAATRGAYFEEFFVRENFQRFTSVVDSHKGPIWYHVAAVMGGFFPFSLFLPGAVWEIFGPLRNALEGAWKSVISKTTASKVQKFLPLLTAFKVLSDTQKLQYFAFLWLVITVGFFSASVSKLLPYTLPAFPAAALLIGMEIDRAISQPAKKRLLIPFSIITFVYAAAFFFGPFALSKVRHLPAGLATLANPASLGMMVAMIVAVVSVIFNKRTLSVAVTLSCHVLLLVLLAPPLMAALSDHWEGPIPHFGVFVGRLQEPTFVFDMRKPGVTFYARRQMYQAWSWATLTSEMSRIPRGYIITRARNRDQLKLLPGTTVVMQEGLYLLARFDNPVKVTQPYVPTPSIFSMQR
ncbi:MAG: glycosyltransferase family 39 protein [Leptolyngbya sp.]|nr:glycosyltransferase family 39 protein [Candidatus Melainabacteria bacterium]